MNYEIRYHKSFFKDIKKLQPTKKEKIKEILRQIIESPTTLPPNSEPLKETPNLFRTRIGKLRLVYHLNHTKNEVFVLGIDSRGEVYKILNRLLN